MRNKAVIFTIKHTIDDDRQPDYLPGVRGAMAALKKKGFLRIGIYHSPGENEAVLAYIAKMLKRELELSYVAVCGHTADEKCLCAKPSPRLVQEAMRAMLVDPEESTFIGASYDDVSMGRAAGIPKVHFVIPDTSGFAGVVAALVSTP